MNRHKSRTMWLMCEYCERIRSCQRWSVANFLIGCRKSSLTLLRASFGNLKLSVQFARNPNTANTTLYSKSHKLSAFSSSLVESRVVFKLKTSLSKTSRRIWPICLSTPTVNFPKQFSESKRYLHSILRDQHLGRAAVYFYSLRRLCKSLKFS